jgi:hypothetical protein
MNLNAKDLEELNTLLHNRKIKIPDFRRTVSPSGANYQWLQKHLMIFNQEVVSSRLKELLEIQ